MIMYVQRTCGLVNFEEKEKVEIIWNLYSLDDDD